MIGIQQIIEAIDSFVSDTNNSEVAIIAGFSEIIRYLDQVETDLLYPKTEELSPWYKDDDIPADGECGKCRQVGSSCICDDREELL